MAKVFPGGSSVTRVFPPSLAGGGGGGVAVEPWTVEYEIDFTAEGAHDFTGGVVKVLSNNGQDVTWTPTGQAGAPGTFELEDGVGLRIIATDQDKKWWGTTNTAPLLSAKIEDMMDGFTTADTVCLQLQVACDPDVAENYNNYGLGLWNGNLTDGYGMVQSRRTYENGQKNGFLRDTALDLTSSATQFNFFEIVWFPGDGEILSSGVLGEGVAFPDPLATTTLRSYTSTKMLTGYGYGPVAVPVWRIAQADGRFAVFAQSWSGGVLDVTAYKMRVLRRNNA